MFISWTSSRLQWFLLSSQPSPPPSRFWETLNRSFLHFHTLLFLFAEQTGFSLHPPKIKELFTSEPGLAHTCSPWWVSTAIFSQRGSHSVSMFGMDSFSQLFHTPDTHPRLCWRKLQGSGINQIYPSLPSARLRGEFLFPSRCCLGRATPGQHQAHISGCCLGKAWKHSSEAQGWVIRAWRLLVHILAT